MNVGPTFFSARSSSTVLLLHLENDLVDSSSYGHTVTAAHGAWPSNTRAKWGDYALTTDGNYRLEVADAPELRFGNLQFSVDLQLWVPSSVTLASDNLLIGKWSTSPTRLSWWLGLGSNGKLRFFSSSNGTTGDLFIEATADAVPRDAWCHVALWRWKDGSNDRIYAAIDGNAYLAYHLTVGTLHGNSAPICIARTSYDTAALPSGITVDEVRMCVGQIDYGTSAFTPPTAPYT